MHWRTVNANLQGKYVKHNQTWICIQATTNHGNDDCDDDGDDDDGDDICEFDDAYGGNDHDDDGDDDGDKDDEIGDIDDDDVDDDVDDANGDTGDERTERHTVPVDLCHIFPVTRDRCWRGTGTL